MSAYDDMGRDAYTRIRQEYSILQELNRDDNVVHPCQCFDFQGHAFLVEPYIDAPTLERYIIDNLVDYWKMDATARDKKQYRNEMNVILKKLDNIIKNIHKKKIVINDIAPQNILIDKELNPIVIDLGSAFHVSERFCNVRTFQMDDRDPSKIDSYCLDKCRQFAFWPESAYYKNIIPADSYIRSMENLSHTPEPDRDYAISSMIIQICQYWNSTVNIDKTNWSFLDGPLGTTSLITSLEGIDDRQKTQAYQYIENSLLKARKKLSLLGIDFSIHTGILGILVCGCLAGISDMEPFYVYACRILAENEINSDMLSKALFSLLICNKIGIMSHELLGIERSIYNKLLHCDNLSNYQKSVLLAYDIAHGTMPLETELAALESLSTRLMNSSAMGLYIQDGDKRNPYLTGASGLILLLSFFESGGFAVNESLLKNWKISNYYNDNSLLNGRSGILFAHILTKKLASSVMNHQLFLLKKQMELLNNRYCLNGNFDKELSLGSGVGGPLLISAIISKIPTTNCPVNKLFG